MPLWSSNTTDYVWLTENKPQLPDAAYISLALWLYENYESVYTSWSIYSDTNDRTRTYTNLRLWVADNYPQIISMIDLLEAAQCE